jgi:hypothetical protein
VTLVGNTPGGKVMQLGKPQLRQQFGRHLITTGIQNLFEGSTVCYPKQPIDPQKNKLQIIATSTDDHPCIMVADQPLIPASSGRVLVDCTSAPCAC